MRYIILFLFGFQAASGQHVYPLWGSAEADEFVTVRVPDASITATHTNFIVYLDLALMPDNFWDNVESDFSDIRVYEDDHTTELNWDSISTHTATDEGMLAIRLTVTDGGDTDFIVDWEGDRAAKGRTFHRVTWTDFKAAWFLNHTGTILNRVTSATAKNMVGKNLEGGDISSGGPMIKYITLDGVNEYFETVGVNSVDHVYPSSYFVWHVIPVADYPINRYYPFTDYGNTSASHAVVWGIFDTNIASTGLKDRFRLVTYNESGSSVYQSIGPTAGVFTDHNDGSTWRMISSSHKTAGGSSSEYYVDGDSYGVSTTLLSDVTSGQRERICALLASSNTYYPGPIAAVTLHTLQRSDEWMDDTHDMLMNQGTFFTFP